MSDEGSSNKKGSDAKKVIVVLENANLEVVKTSKGVYELLNADDHAGIHRKRKRDPRESRPDIAHQCLLALLDSPLNKAGHLQIYVRTADNVLIEVSLHVRLPRTYKRFSGLMVQLLHKLKIRAVDGNKTLLKVIKNPITRHLPVNCRKFGAEVNGTLIDVHEFVDALPDDGPVVFAFGAFAHGDIDINYVEETLCFSEYQLSGAKAIERLLCAFERKWGIL